MRHAAPLALLALLLPACGGPSPSSFHKQHRGQSTEQIRAALGAPIMAENMTTGEDEPPRERWFYHRARALGTDDSNDTGYLVIEFSANKEDHVYDMDADQFKRLNADAE